MKIADTKLAESCYVNINLFKNYHWKKRYRCKLISWPIEVL